VEWPKEAWFDYQGVRRTLELASAEVGWSPGYYFACPHCGLALVVRHDATHHTLSIAPNGALTAKEPLSCPKHASRLLDTPPCGWHVRVLDGQALDCEGGAA
jgi:hypothetical protein